MGAAWNPIAISNLWYNLAPWLAVVQQRGLALAGFGGSFGIRGNSVDAPVVALVQDNAR